MHFSAGEPDAPFQYVPVSSFAFTPASDAPNLHRGRFLPAVQSHFAGEPQSAVYYTTYSASSTEQISEASLPLIYQDTQSGISQSFTNMLFTDNRLSCSLFARCPLPAVPGTFYCNLHLRAMVDLAVRFNLDPVTKAANRQVHRSQPAYDLDLNAASEADVGQLRVLRNMYEKSPREPDRGH